MMKINILKVNVVKLLTGKNITYVKYDHTLRKKINLLQQIIEKLKYVVSE